ncbi:hypothetical protein G6F59_018597 [Rhizopus arrhizus]|nr:hypothetical protein G6F59_018597 [Rhizopus arrhizus]
MRPVGTCPKIAPSNGSISAKIRALPAAAARNDGHSIHINERKPICVLPSGIGARGARAFAGLGRGLLDHQAALDHAFQDRLVREVAVGEGHGS